MVVIANVYAADTMSHALFYEAFMLEFEYPNECDKMGHYSFTFYK